MSGVRSIGGVALALAGALVACDAPRAPSPQLWTLFDVRALYGAGKTEADVIAADAGLPGGIPLGTMLDAASPELFVKPTWAEGYRAAYVTTEVWAYFDEIWVQPMYVPIKGWNDGAPDRIVDANNVWHPIFSVGPESGFYSPYWQIIYVEAPNAADGDITSVRQVIDGGYPLTPSTGWVAALAPDTLGLSATPFPTGGADAGEGWLDGAPISFVKFPAAPFAWNADLEVEEVPIFHFVFARADGTFAAPAIPSVLGTGALYSNTPPPVDNNGLPTAEYSAYWRLYTVVVPENARVFAPPGSSTAAALESAGVAYATTYGDEIKAVTDPDAMFVDVLGRVALDPACFTSPASINPQVGSCRYLDSQDKIEKNLPRGSIVRTDVTVTCPLVSVNGAAVTP